MSYTRLRPGFTLTQDRLAELQAVLPEAFADGRINWDVLRETLDPFLEEEGPGAEHYGLVWPGKREARRLAAMPSRGALHPVPGEGVNEDATHNIFIEGDNLEVLKLLLKSYAGRVKMIYIDPPYNTGNDFVYEDDYSEPLEGYLRVTGQGNDEGQAVTTNPETAGRKHSNWLSMMYPRLLLARGMLTDDGLIFVSIDDNEVANLQLVMNEVFGEENFITQLVWQKAYGGGPKTRYVVGLHEYVLCYCREKTALSSISLPPDPEVRKYYTGKDEKFSTRGPYRMQPLATKSMDERPNLRFPIIWNGEEIWPEKQWQWSRQRVENALQNGELVISRERDKWTVNYKQYLYDEDGQERGAKPFSILAGPYTQIGTAEVKDILGDGKVFPFPKPTELIKKLLAYIQSDKDAVILDFFAGSGTTAHAVLQMNQEDGGRRRFVLVQVPESTATQSEARQAGFSTIADISKERIRRVLKKMQAESDSRLLDDRETPLDLGFRAFKLASSDVRPWRDFDGTDISALEDLFSQAETPLVDGWSRQDVLTEVMLLDGFPLDSAMAHDDRFAANDVTRVTSDTRVHALYVCLDERIVDETAQYLQLDRNDVFVCLDSALSDESKMRLADVCNLQTI